MFFIGQIIELQNYTTCFVGCYIRLDNRQILKILTENGGMVYCNNWMDNLTENGGRVPTPPARQFPRAI